MAVSLSGFARDNRGFGRNGVQVLAINTTSNLVVATTTTVDHPTTGERGWWNFTDLADATYRVEIQWPGDTQVVSGEEKRQFGGLVVGNSVRMEGDTGTLRLWKPWDVPDGGSIPSPGIHLIGAHDSNPAGGQVTRADKEMSFYVDVNPGGGTALYFRNDDSVPIVQIYQDGTVSVWSGGAWHPLTLDNHTHAPMSASDILAAVKTVDGDGSGLDADLLDGKHEGQLAVASATNADTLDGLHAAAFKPLFYRSLTVNTSSFTGWTSPMEDVDITLPTRAIVIVHAQLTFISSSAAGWYSVVIIREPGGYVESVTTAYKSGTTIDQVVQATAFEILDAGSYSFAAYSNGWVNPSVLSTSDVSKNRIEVIVFPVAGN